MLSVVYSCVFGIIWCHRRGWIWRWCEDAFPDKGISFLRCQSHVAQAQSPWSHVLSGEGISFLALPLSQHRLSSRILFCWFFCGFFVLISSEVRTTTAPKRSSTIPKNCAQSASFFSCLPGWHHLFTHRLSFPDTETQGELVNFLYLLILTNRHLLGG